MTSKAHAGKRKTTRSGRGSSGTRTMITKDQSSKPFISARDIREKMIKRHEAKEEAIQRRKGIKGQKLGTGFMKATGTKSDVSENDPNDPMVQEKLKTLLSNGSFDFGDKQRAVLSQILAKQ